ncbi:hypothetical protein PF005_g14198 [Phytophthora fragariae]|uniref:RxLR effector protein n=1 Tax=Phytophthora fragariae TaxID=53985 RepID=A0A6A3RUF0_9STRA|nr:hypothetical protein PF003_g15433 [Phytophthora fragariae]KAE8934533.1 hypothetical protein PF009_g15483 [Phytophthora fragariae]KAE8989673.1 hypothetical protein PF011_g18663 [Phytophthora fragariae]KAE9103155.1 hypothetical protein PF010_g13837 [Phytophthora fragariae]KAE9103311.1 hypothetical protein PF007_g14446 [Phytophthora fragariae]
MTKFLLTGAIVFAAAAGSISAASALPVERGLRGESASLTGSAATANEEKICYVLFWPFQC